MGDTIFPSTRFVHSTGQGRKHPPLESDQIHPMDRHLAAFPRSQYDLLTERLKHTAHIQVISIPSIKVLGRSKSDVGTPAALKCHYSIIILCVPICKIGGPPSALLWSTVNGPNSLFPYPQNTRFHSNISTHFINNIRPS